MRRPDLPPCGGDARQGRGGGPAPTWGLLACERPCALRPSGRDHLQCRAPPGNRGAVDGKVQPSLHNIRKVAAVTTYGGSRFRAMLMGDPPRKLIKRMLRATVKPGAPVGYLANYAMNLSTDGTRKAFVARVAASMDAF